MEKIDNRVYYNPENMNINKKKPTIKYKKKKVKFLIPLSIILILSLLIFFIVYSLGFIPIGLYTIEPEGNAKSVDIENLINKFPSMADMPNLDKLEYEAYDTDASINSIVESYGTKLINEGYSLKYNGTIEIDGVTFQAYCYLKGLTAVGILTTDEITEDYDSLVLYVTGNAFDFRAILNWYKNN